MTNVPVAEKVPPKNVKTTWFAEISITPVSPDVTQLLLFGPTQIWNSDPEPTVAEKGPPSGVIVTVPVSDVLRLTGLPSKLANAVAGSSADSSTASATFNFPMLRFSHPVLLMFSPGVNHPFFC